MAMLCVYVVTRTDGTPRAFSSADRAAMFVVRNYDVENDALVLDEQGSSSGKDWSIDRVTVDDDAP